MENCCICWNSVSGRNYFRSFESLPSWAVREDLPAVIAAWKEVVVRWGLFSSAVSQMKTWKEVALSCTRGGSVQIFKKKTPKLKGQLGIGISCPVRCCSHHPWKCLRGVWIWHLGMWFRDGYCGVELMILKVFCNLVDSVLHQNFHTMVSNILVSSEPRTWEVSMGIAPQRPPCFAVRPFWFASPLGTQMDLAELLLWQSFNSSLPKAGIQSAWTPMT